jgi:hypothetical protein
MWLRQTGLALKRGTLETTQEHGDAVATEYGTQATGGVTARTMQVWLIYII